jgi:hypothetical protein
LLFDLCLASLNIKLLFELLNYFLLLNPRILCKPNALLQFIPLSFEFLDLTLNFILANLLLGFDLNLSLNFPFELTHLPFLLTHLTEHLRISLLHGFQLSCQNAVLQIQLDVLRFQRFIIWGNGWDLSG